MRKMFLFLGISLLLTGCLDAKKNDIALPFSTDFKSAKGWSLDAGAKFDSSVSASAGSGSIRLAKAGSSWVMCDRIISDFKLPVESGRTYTLSFKSKTQSFPPPALEVYGAMLGEDGVIANSGGTMCANSQKGVWEENYVVIRIPKNDMIKYFKPKILMLPKRGISAPVWIDDIRFEEGVKLPLRSLKKQFEGSVTRIDSLGNIEIKKDGRFVPFFPIGIYVDEKRADWSIYKKMGFNINMWASSAASIMKSKKAGLYAMMQVVQYIVPVSDDWIPQDPVKKATHLHTTLQNIKKKGLFENLLFYYIDNEFYHMKSSFIDTVDMIRKEDQGAHPIYMLSGSYGLARMYNNYVDLTGTYVAEDGYETPIVENFEVLDKTPGQQQPVVFAQINRGVGENFRAVLYGAIAKGARGVGFWRDGGSAGRIEKRPVAKQLPKIAKEIVQLMPLILTDHQTKWQATSSSEKLLYGTRELNGEAYLIVSNPTRKVVDAAFTFKGVPYQPRLAEDYFSHQKIGDVKNGVLSLSIQPHDALVVKLAR